MPSRPVIPHTLADQLRLMRDTHELELLLVKKRQSQDQDDIETAFAADAAWSGQYERLKKEPHER